MGADGAFSEVGVGLDGGEVDLAGIMSSARELGIKAGCHEFAEEAIAIVVLCEERKEYWKEMRRSV